MDFINKMIKKFCTKEIILYLIFGVITTFVNIGVFYCLTKFATLEENLSNAIAIICAVLVAYFTNRKWVFESKASSFQDKLMEFYKFMLGRAFTMIVEFFGFYLLFNFLHVEELISKISMTIIVIILNYFVSKFYAFKKPKEINS